MIKTENDILNKVLSNSFIPQDFKEQLKKEFQRIEEYAKTLELELKIKEEKINSLNQKITKLKTENKVDDNLFFEGTGFDKDNDQFSSKTKRGNSFPSFWKKFKFLLIEDNRADIILLKSIFKLWGLHLDIVSSIQEAKEKMQEKYDCILSDVVLPDGDGLGHILELRLDKKALNQNTAVIIITARANKNGARAAQLANVQCYFNKPFSLKQLKIGLEQIFKPTKLHDKFLTKVVLDSKDSWTWLDILNHNLNGRYPLMEEFMIIFLNQAKNVIKLLSSPIREENLDLVQYNIFKFQSTVNTIGLKDSYCLISKICRDINTEFIKGSLGALIDPCIIQLRKDMEKVERQIN